MSLLVFGSVWFWLLFLLAWVLITIAIELGYQIRATIVVLMFFVLYFFFGGKEALASLLHYITYKPFHSIGWILGYFVLGTAWSVAKWAFFVLRKRDKALDTLRKETERYHYTPTEVKPPQVSEHKNLIVGWMIYWPFSALWTLINDPVKRAFTWIYYRISKRLQTISDHLFQSVNNEVENIRQETGKK